MKQSIIILLCLLMMSGCATVPTEQQLALADYGEYPTNYQEVAKNYYNAVLIDPYSAHYRWLKEPYKGYFRQFGTFEFGYIIHVGVNSKNRFGGYVGEEQQALLIKNGNVTNVLPLWLLQ